MIIPRGVRRKVGRQRGEETASGEPEGTRWSEEVPTSRTHPLVLVSLFKGLASAAWYHYTLLPPSGQAQSPPARAAATLLPLPLCRIPPNPESTPGITPLPAKKRCQWFSAGSRPRIQLCTCTDIYARGLVGRVVPSTRHEALEKRRCPRMYFLIIDFNDEGSRCQRHLGCWAE